MRVVRALALLLSLVAFPVLAADGPPEGRLLRFPDIHGDFVVFVYGGDLWRAPTAGGPALRLTSHAGVELFPKISPDGSQIAFTGEYTGSRQVYVMPAWGGTPRQLTYYTDVGTMPPRGGWDYWIQGWTGDGKIVVRANRTAWGERMGTYYVVDPAGGLEVPLADLPHGGSSSLSPDGTKLAYCPIDREFRTWKRTRGGRAQDIWVYDLEANRSTRITDDPGTDNFPMWVGDRIYFTSDRKDILNLYVHDLKSGQVRPVTTYAEGDVLWPERGPGAIVFMRDGSLWRLDLASEQVSRIDVRLGADLPGTVPYFKDVTRNIDAASPSRTGARAVFGARGEIFTVPAEEGTARNLTRTQGVRERDPAWSPDGRWIAYLSDATGAYELYVRPADGSGTPRQLTTGGGRWPFEPVWSPDSARIALSDRGRRLRVIEVATGDAAVADTSDQDDLDSLTWSPDGRWIAYEKTHPAARLRGIAVYSIAKKEAFFLSDGMTQDTSPAFSADGQALFFLSDRDYVPTFSAFEFNYLYPRATRVYAATLAKASPGLFPVRIDEEKPDGEDKDAAAEGDEDNVHKEKSDLEKKAAKKEKAPPKKDGTEEEKKKENGDKSADAKEPPKPKPTVIDRDGFNARTVSLPGVERGDYRSVQAAAGFVFYLRDDTDGKTSLYRYDLKERKEEKVLGEVQGYALTRDGKKLLWRSGQAAYGIADAKPGLKAGDGKLDLSGMKVKLDPRAEWAQIFEDAVRTVRDWFYEPNLHGLDWDRVAARYRALVPYVAHRGDLDFVLGEMVSELEAGHTYVSAGDEPRVERVRGGMLGCTFAADPSGRYRIAKIFAGENWDDDGRSPLTEPGIDVKEGDLLLAVDGEELTTRDNPYRLLENKADKPVILTVGSGPDLAKGRKVTVRPIGSELNLRYLDWVRGRMALADKLSGGKVGYLHLPDTALSGNRMLQKLFYSQSAKPALVIDDRYNGGGFIPDRMIEMLGRTTMAYWARRDVASSRTPGFAHDGPKAMLVNGYSSSGGDALPYFFRQRKLGPVIGTRTWGGLIGLSGGPRLVDGGSVDVPSFRIYDPSGQWVVENEGVAPDVEVIDLPEALAAGRDPSLEKAVEILMKELQAAPARPAVPAAPDMTK